MKAQEELHWNEKLAGLGSYPGSKLSNSQPWSKQNFDENNRENDSFKNTFFKIKW